MPQLKNTSTQYGWISIFLHWLMAVGTIATYAIGDLMVELEYYDPWYLAAPDYHKILGIMMGMFLVLRVAWTVSQEKPQPLDNHLLLNKLAQVTHYFFYLAIALLVISGYLIATAKGKGIDIAGLMEIPALLPANAERGEFAGEIHEFVAEIFILVVALHVAAALAHHFIFRDQTLLRMLRVRR